MTSEKHRGIASVVTIMILKDSSKMHGLFGWRSGTAVPVWRVVECEGVDDGRNVAKMDCEDGRNRKRIRRARRGGRSSCYDD